MRPPEFDARRRRTFRRISRIHGIQEGVELELERLADLATGACSKPICRLVADRKDHQVLPAVVERDVLLRLEQPQFADALGGNPAGREIGDAAVGELQAHVGDVHLARTGWRCRRRGSPRVRRRVSASTMSRSWIIRSSTTSTSRLRGLNTLRRWISKKSGSVARRSSAATAGLKRSRWPTCRMRPCRSAAVDQARRRSRGRARWAFPPARRCRLRAVRSRPLRGTRSGRRQRRHPPCPPVRAHR